MVSTLPESASASPTYPDRRVYAVVGVPPEIQAYALAKYSRSNQGMLETIQELSQQRAEQFLNTFYFQYGHRSIADLAHLVFGLEQISILAAMAVVDEPVWDGQERSTRYQPFRRTGWHLPAEVAGSAFEATFAQTAEGLFSAYHALTSALQEHLQDAVPRPAELEEGTYKRTLRARAFDLARGLLPLATYTSVGQIVSARVAERQIGRLLESEYAEVRSVGAELKQACQVPACAPLSGVEQPPAAPTLVNYAEQPPAVPTVVNYAEQPPAAPTLVKYADASPYHQQVRAELSQATASFLSVLGEPERARPVELAEPADPLDEAVATLLYRHDAQGHSYRHVQSAVGAMSPAQRAEVLDLSLRGRGSHDDLLREHQVGYGLIFDILVDLGSFRDLHRHRRCVQIQQPLSFSAGFLPAEDVFVWGLGEQAGLAALEAGLGDTYTEWLHKTKLVAESMSPAAGTYLLPLAFRTRCLFKMDWAQAAYMIEQRTQPQGHFSYRRIAWGMFEALRQRWPQLAQPIRAHDPDAPLDLLRR